MSIPKWLEDNEFEAFALGGSMHVVYSYSDGDVLSMIGREVVFRNPGETRYLALVPQHVGTVGQEKPYPHPDGRASIVQINHDHIITIVQHLGNPEEPADEQG